MVEMKTRIASKRIFFLEKIGYYFAPFILMAVDYIAIVFSVYQSQHFRDYVVVDLLRMNNQIIEISPIYICVIFPLIFISFIAYGELYSKRRPFWQCVEILFKMCIYTNMLAILISYSFGTANSISRFFMVALWLLSFFNLCLFRQLSKWILIRLALWQRPVVIVGAGKTAEIIAKTFENEPGIGYKIVGLIEDNYKECPLVKKYPHIGNFRTLEAAILASKVRDVIIAAPGLKREELVSLMQRTQPFVRNLTIVPDLFGIPMANIEAESFPDDRMIMLKTKNNLQMPVNRFVKRCFDIIVGGLAFIMIMPILLLLAVCIKLDSKGPVLHIAERIGKKQEKFSCYKFRTMYVDNERILKEYFAGNKEAEKEWKEFAKLRCYDPRVTKVGKWMRRYSLDELPQIANVLLGNMSLVGPRPYLPREKEAMGYYVLTISQTVPGITGLWQVSGRNNIKFSGRLKLDAWYVRNWSVWQDIILLLKTVRVVFKKDGAY